MNLGHEIEVLASLLNKSSVATGREKTNKCDVCGLEGDATCSGIFSNINRLYSMSILLECNDHVRS